MIGLRSPRVRAVLVAIAVVFTPLGIARALAPWAELDEATLLALPVAILLGAWLGWRVVRPLEKLEAQVQHKADARADLSLDRTPGDDEYARLTGAMNALLERLDARQKAHEAFVADLVHALKSPIAALRVAADRLGEGGLDETRLSRLGTAIDRSAGRLDAIARALLELARAEGGLPGEVRVPTDVATLAREIAAAAAEDGRWPHVALRVDAPATLIGDVVEDRLRSAIEQLLDNARSFARREVRLVVEPGRRITIEDDGPGVPPDDRSRIFERFFTTRSSEGGTGLGLAWVRAVAEAHGGNARFEPPSRFVIELP